MRAGGVGRVVLLGLALSGLAACDDRSTTAHEARVETDVQVRADSETGQVAVRIPGLDANVPLPKAVLDNSHFDLDGVTLYPGSKVASVNVNAKDSNGHHQAEVALSFVAPAEVAKVRDWFAQAFAAKAASVRNEAGVLVGQMPDGSSFRLAFAPQGADQTKGSLQILEKN